MYLSIKGLAASSAVPTLVSVAVVIPVVLAGVSSSSVRPASASTPVLLPVGLMVRMASSWSTVVVMEVLTSAVLVSLIVVILIVAIVWVMLSSIIVSGAVVAVLGSGALATSLELRECLVAWHVAWHRQDVVSVRISVPALVTSTIISELVEQLRKLILWTGALYTRFLHSPHVVLENRI